MFFRPLIVSLLILCGSCAAETGDSNKKSAGAVFEIALGSFSGAVSASKPSSFVAISNPQGVHLVRKFTSGNLGGRGKELSKNVSASLLNSEMEFPVKDQTPFSLKILFPGLPIKSYKALPHYQFTVTKGLSFDQWAPVLTKTLVNVPEAVNGSPVILVSSNYWVYSEAQVIDGVVVGGFAVFKKVDEGFVLLSLIDFL